MKKFLSSSLGTISPNEYFEGFVIGVILGLILTQYYMLFSNVFNEIYPPEPPQKELKIDIYDDYC